MFFTKPSLAISVVFGGILIAVGGNTASAESRGLSVRADSCAIHHALTGTTALGCGSPAINNLGAIRSVADSGYSGAAAPSTSDPGVSSTPASSTADSGFAGTSSPFGGGSSLGYQGRRSTDSEEPVQEYQEDVTRGYYIRFAFNSGELTREYREHLVRLAKVLRSPELSDSCIKLVGHTDVIGSARYNQSLSSVRANSVYAFLSGPGGVNKARLLQVAKGERQTLAGLPGTHPLNRRVEILARDSSGQDCR